MTVTGKVQKFRIREREIEALGLRATDRGDGIAGPTSRIRG
jgi:hypothetical protein